MFEVAALELHEEQHEQAHEQEEVELEEPAAATKIPLVNKKPCEVELDAEKNLTLELYTIKKPRIDLVMYEFRSKSIVTK